MLKKLWNIITGKAKLIKAYNDLEEVLGNVRKERDKAQESLSRVTGEKDRYKHSYEEIIENPNKYFTFEMFLTSNNESSFIEYESDELFELDLIWINVQNRRVQLMGYHKNAGQVKES